MVLARLRNFLQRAGWVAAPPNRSIIICVPTLGDGERLDWLVSKLRHRNERLSIFFLPGNAAVSAGLRARFEHAVLDIPWNNQSSTLLFLLTSRMRLLLAIRNIWMLPAALVKQAHAHGIAIAVIEADPPPVEIGRGGGEIAQLVDWWLPRNQATATALREFGVPTESIAEWPPGTGSPESAGSAGFDHLNYLMARRPPDRRGLQKLVMASFDHPAARRFVSLRAQRIEGLEELRNMLGRPETILCLGNGPSSEDPALAKLKFDCLFRVNHRWLERGLFCQPDLIFTGQKRTLFTVSGPIFAFQTRRAEAHLVTHQIFNPLCRRMRYVTLERLGVLGGLDWDGVRPTNGATMLAAAVALEPKRLIIAGMDLFEDPAGAYPGDDMTPNDYVLVHERDLEIAFILDTLRAYRGELVILSKALAEKWNALRQAGSEDRWPNARRINGRAANENS